MVRIPFIRYAIRFMNRLSFVKKFLVVSVMFIFPLVILGGALFKEINESINITKAEREGITLMKHSYDLLFAAATYRDIQMVARANNSEALQTRISAQTEEVERLLVLFEEHISTLSESKLPPQLDILKENWNNLKTTSAGAAGGPNIQFQFYDSFVNNVELLVNVVTYDRKLIHDPSLKTFLLINIMIKDLPASIRSLGKARAYGSYALGLTAIDFETFKTLDKIYDELIAGQLLLEQSLDYALELDSGKSKEKLKTMSVELLEGINDGGIYFYENIIEKDFITEKWDSYFDRITQSFDNTHNIINTILPSIDEELRKRIISQETKLFSLLISSALISLIIFYMYCAVYFSINSHINTFAKKASLVASGDLSVKMDIESKDELSQLYRAFNEMLTQLKEHQDKLFQAEKMASLGGMIAGIAHEMNTPMGVIKTAASQITDSINNLNYKFTEQTMKRADLEHCLSDSGQIMELIDSNTERCISLISTFKQLNIYQKEKETELVDINEVLVGIPKLFENETDDEEISKIITVNADADLEAKLDRDLLVLVIGNIISNATTHAFRDKQGEIEIEGTSDGDQICIKVKDNGSGIDEDTLEKAFEPFFTTKRNQGSIGLGLHIVFIVVTQALSGKIKINSTLGTGTEVIMHFPKE